MSKNSKQNDSRSESKNDPSKNELAGIDDLRVEKFVGLLNQYQVRLGNFIETLVPDYQIAQDLLQNTSLILWQKLAEYEENSDFWAWACKIAHYEVLHYRRSMARNKMIFSDELVQQLASVAQKRSEVQNQRASALRICLGKLSKKQRGIVQNRYSSTSSVQEIAEQNSTSPNAISKLLQRARLTLMQCIERTLKKEVPK